MNEDEPFLRALLAHPNDRVTKLVYADWLDDRADPRAEYLRVEVRLAELSADHPNRPDLRSRQLEMQPALPVWWVAIAGTLRATSPDHRSAQAHEEHDPVSLERVPVIAEALGYRPTCIDTDGYEISIRAGAISGLTGAIAYLESRSRWRGGIHDIRYHLILRATDGREVAREPKSYNPFFGCRARFLEWYGDVVVFIFREKHTTYISRFDFDGPSVHRSIPDDWVLNGPEIGYRTYGARTVSRLSVPGLEPLPKLSEAEAAERELLPRVT